MKGLFTRTILLLLVWVSPALSAEAQPAARVSEADPAVPASGASGALSQEDLEVIAMMDILQMLDLAQAMDLAQDLDVLIEED